MNEEFIASLTPMQKAEIRNMLLGRKKEEQLQKLERYRRLNKLARPHQTVFVGSSLMEQFPIQELLADCGENVTVYNRGIGGITTVELMEYLDVCVYELQPDRIYINIGTNDLNQSDYTEEGLIERYRTILLKIREKLPNVRLFLLAYYPVNQAAASGLMGEALKLRTNQRIMAANRAVEKLAGELGATYLDVNHGLKDASGNLKAEYTVDGMHMYADGYAVVLQNLLPYLTKE